jgi:hypothetical protein
VELMSEIIPGPAAPERYGDYSVIDPATGETIRRGLTGEQAYAVASEYWETSCTPLERSAWVRPNAANNRTTSG